MVDEKQADGGEVESVVSPLINDESPLSDEEYQQQEIWYTEAEFSAIVEAAYFGLKDTGLTEEEITDCKNNRRKAHDGNE